MRRLVDIIGLGGRLETERPSVPDHLAVFAVGDIHGRADLLVKMHQEILRQAKTLPADMRKTIIYLGDYIDHGPDSADVIDLLLSAALPGFRSIHLLGNHELSFLNFLKGEGDYLISPQMRVWLYENGGAQTLKSYGIPVSPNADLHEIQQMRIDLLRKIPTDHFGFLENLQLSYSIGDFFFAHAGVDPYKPLNEQNPSDLLSITEPFLSNVQTLDKVIIHGHTPTTHPCIRSNRIGLDTDAVRSGVLSGLMIIKDGFRILNT